MLLVNGTDHDTLKKGARAGRADVHARRKPPRLHSRAPHDVPRAVLAHRQAAEWRPRHDRGSLRDLHLRRDTTSHREIDRSLGAALAPARARRAAGLPPSLLRVTPVHRLCTVAACRASRRKAVRAEPLRRAASSAPARPASRARLRLAATSTSASAAAARAIMCDSCPVTGSSTNAVPGRTGACAEELIAVSVAPNGRREPALEEHRTRDGRALEGEQSRPHEDLGTDERGNRIAGKSEDERRPAHAERQRLSRLDGDAPEDLLDAEARSGSGERDRAGRRRRRPR